MLTATLKSKVNELWDKFWSGGISNPLNAIEQITYLLFMKQLDENDKRRVSNAEFTGEEYTSIFAGRDFYPPGVDPTKEENAVDKETLRWSYFKRMTAEEMFLHMQSKVFPFIKTLGETDSFFAKHMNNAVFLIPKASLLIEAIKVIDSIYEELEKQSRFMDTQGDFYEYLLKQLNQAGKNGQFRTPTHIIELIVELVGPKLGDRIADPACGSAGFLLAAYKYLVTLFTSEEYIEADENGFKRGTRADKLVSEDAQNLLQKETFHGFDIDPTMIRIGLMNLMMHGIENPKIDYTDTLSKFYNEDNLYHVVLANPPFTGSLDKSEINTTFSLDTRKTELLFLERIYKMLRIGGTAGVIVPQGVLFGSGKAFVDARKILIDKCELKAVISLPSGVFKPYAGVATAILIFTKGGETNNIWFYDMKSDGYSLDDKRTPLFKSNNERDFGDLHTIIQEYRKKEKNSDPSQQHFTVSKAEIVRNEYDLSLSKYKEHVYEEARYDKPNDILEDLSRIEYKILDGIAELKSLIK
jgi:type I restriction enzyme M protein